MVIERKFRDSWICRTGKWQTEHDGLESDGPENDGLENDGVEQEETYILHTMKWTQTNVYDTLLFHAQIQIHILRVLFEGLGATMWSTA